MAEDKMSDLSEIDNSEIDYDYDVDDMLLAVEPEIKHWEEDLVTFSGFNITTYVNKKGDEVKKLQLPAWKEITEPQPYIEGTGQAVRTGKWSNITVIDFDDKELYNFMCEKFAWIKEQSTVKTRKGFHIYAKFNPELIQYGLEVAETNPELVFFENDKPCKAKIDIQQSSEIVICPPTQYKTKDKTIHKYEWIKKNDSLNDIPQEIIDYLNPEVTKIKKGLIKAKPKATKKKVKEVNDENTFPESSSNKPNDEIGEIIDLLCKYNEKYPYHYNEWFKIMCACYGAGQEIDQVTQYREFAHKISKISGKYDEKDTNKKFNEGCKFNYTEGTLRHFAKEAYPDEYREIIRKNVNLSGKCLFEERELRDYFIRMWGDNVFTFRNEPGIFYIWIERESRWIIDNGNQLKYHIIEQIYELFEENLKEFKKAADETRKEYYKLINKYPEPDEQQQKMIDEAEKVYKFNEASFKTLRKVKLTFGNNKVAAIYQLIKSKLNCLALETNMFDEKRTIFAFRNICYNLETKEFFKATKLDYILRTCKKDYFQPQQEDVKFIEKWFEQIFTDEEKRRAVLSVLFCGLSGIRHEKFIVFTGAGRNGKGLLNEYMEYLLSHDYFYRPPISILTKQPGDATNQGMRNMHKKRYAVWSEPEEKNSDGGSETSLKSNLIKELTGNESVNACGKYEKDTDTRIHATFIMECNKKPKLTGEKDHAIKSRMVIIDFDSIFIDETDKEMMMMIDEPNHFLMNKELKSPEMKEKLYCAFFQYVIDNNEKLDLYIPQTCVDSALNYLQSEDEFAEWFKEHYERYEGVEQPYKYFIPVKHIYEIWKAHLEDVNKREARKFNEKKIKETLQSNILVKPYYKESRKVTKVKTWKFEEGSTYHNKPEIAEWELLKQNGTDGVVNWRPIYKDGSNHAMIPYSENCESKVKKPN